ncbi:MAG: hypothetical protein KAJ33_08990, partial [Thermoplasmata archaeon]|nr:hypothetical protein [Thermoplasmata archaeon]
NNILSGLGLQSELLGGVFIADSIYETNIPGHFEFIEVEDFIVEDESCVVPAVFGQTQYIGTVACDVWVTAKLKSSDGTSVYMKCKMQKDGGLFDGFAGIPFINGGHGRFLMANGTKYLPKDTYDVDIEITGWDLSGGTHLGSYSYPMTTDKNYSYPEDDINGNSNEAISVSDGEMYRSLGYLDDEYDWYSIYLDEGDLLRVKYTNVNDANVEVTVYDPLEEEIATTDWSWSTTIIKVARYTGTYKIMVEYDVPGIYCLDIGTIREDSNNNFNYAENISINWDHINATSPTMSIEDGVSLTDLHDYYSVYLEKGQYIYAWYSNLGGTGLFGDANVELFLYNSDQICIDDTDWDISTDVEGYATKDGVYYLRISRDTEDGFFSLSYNIIDGPRCLESSSSLIVEDNDYVSGWLAVTPSGTMEHWYAIYVYAGETITVDMTGNTEMWLFASATEVDTTDWSFKTSVSHTATSSQWYYLAIVPDGDTNYTLSFSVN